MTQTIQSKTRVRGTVPKGVLVLVGGCSAVLAGFGQGGGCGRRGLEVAGEPPCGLRAAFEGLAAVAAVCPLLDKLGIELLPVGSKLHQFNDIPNILR